MFLNILCSVYMILYSHKTVLLCFLFKRYLKLSHKLFSSPWYFQISMKYKSMLLSVAKAILSINDPKKFGHCMSSLI